MLQPLDRPLPGAVQPAQRRQAPDIVGEQRHRQAGQNRQSAAAEAPAGRHQHQCPGDRQPAHDVDLHLRILRLGIEIEDGAGQESDAEDRAQGPRARIAPGAPQHGQRHGRDRHHPHRRGIAPDVPARDAGNGGDARAQQIGHHAIPQIADLGPGEARPDGAHRLARPQEVDWADGTLVAAPGPGDDTRRGDHAGEEEGDPAQPPRRPFLAEPQRRQHGGEGGEHQPPFHQPGDREQHRDCGDPRRGGPGEPHAGQRHGGEQHGVARQDVLVDDGEEHHEARGEMEHRRQERDQAIAGHGADQQIDSGEAEAAAHRVQDGDLPPRIAGEHAQKIEQPAERTVERIIEIVRGIERRVGGVADPGLQLQALEHAVAGEPALGVVEPQHDRDQKRAAAQHEQREIGDITA